MSKKWNDTIENRFYDCVQALHDLVQAARATGNPESPTIMRSMDDLRIEIETARREIENPFAG